MTVDWGKRGDYIAKHGVTAAQASEALTDPDAVVFDPDTHGASAWKSNSRDRRYYRLGGPDE